MNISSRMDSHFTGLWVNFFTTAGIPSEVAATYALTFTENRIQNDMLLDLNKEYLRDMGITRMGDVIAILRHAKQVHENTARDRVLSSTSTGAVPRVPVAAVAGRLTAAQSKPTSPASRILEHYTRNATPEASPPRSAGAAPKRKSADNFTGTDATMDIKKTRSIRFSNPLPASSSEAAAAMKQTVFARLGNSEVTKPAASTQTARPIYSRLGAKPDEKAPKAIPIPVPKDALKYEGILKSNPVKTTISITASKNSIRRIAVGSMRADETPVSVKEKLALGKPNAISNKTVQTKPAPVKAKSVKFSNKVEYKEIDAVNAKPVSVFNKPERRLAMPVATSSDNNGVKARLGNKSSNNLTITKNVFNRLGA